MKLNSKKDSEKLWPSLPYFFLLFNLKTVSYYEYSAIQNINNLH